MLQINRPWLPRLETRFELGWPRQLQLSPVPAADDELTEDVANDATTHDNEWQLNERPNSLELDTFWTKVITDIKSDPEWVDFSRND